MLKYLKGQSLKHHRFLYLYFGFSPGSLVFLSPCKSSLIQFESSTVCGPDHIVNRGELLTSINYGQTEYVCRQHLSLSSCNKYVSISCWTGPFLCCILIIILISANINHLRILQLVDNISEARL